MLSTPDGKPDPCVCHDKCCDGSGYPRGLNGEAIPLAARIFRTVDVWNALTTKRPCHSAEPPEMVLEYLQSQSGKLFDPEITRVFAQLMKK